MFVVSMKTSKTKLATIACAVAALLLAVVFLPKGEAAASVPSGGVNLNASNAEERVAFLAQFGWEIDADPVEVAEIIIPAEFDDVYEQYNTLQKQQDFDLGKYCGMRVKRWTYTVKNYPGYTDSTGRIHANLLVYEGKVIGGDVCSVELDGFMHGFDRPAETAEALTDVPAA